MSTVTSPMLSSKTRMRRAQAQGAPNFDRLARAYRWMEYLSFGPALWRCRTEFLSQMTKCRNALVIGDGDGRFTARLLETNPAIRVDAVDASPAMLRALTLGAGPNAQRVCTEVADARAWQPKNATPYDLVVTHFFLDCLTTAEIRQLAARIQALAAPEAKWVVSEFAIPHSLFGRLVARPLVAALYLAFGILTGLKVRILPNHASALAATGFQLARRRTRLWGLLVSELWTNHKAR